MSFKTGVLRREQNIKFDIDGAVYPNSEGTTVDGETNAFLGLPIQVPSIISKCLGGRVSGRNE